MPWTIQVACAFVLFVSNTFAQVYHYETGKVIPVSRPGQIIWKEGVFQNFLADYGTLVVLENPKNPKSKLINIPVIKVKCLQPDSVKEPHFVLHGGPGESNIQTTLLFSGMLQKHDVILVGYRGVDGSVSLQEPHYQSALTCDSLSLKNQKIVFAKAAHEAIRFFNEKKIEWEGFGLESVVDDIEEFRKNEGYPKISFLAFSYGTMIAQLYSETYPQNMETNIYIGARPLGNFWLSDSLFHEQLYQLFKKYKQQKNEADTSWSDFSRLMAPALDTHHLAAADINPVLFDLFFFSQCYSFDNALQLFATLDKVPSKGYNKLVQKYKEFYKNYPNLVLGDLLVKKKIPEAKLWIVGNGYLKSRLEKFSVDDVTFWGHLPLEKKNELMSRAHVILVPGVREGWGLVVTEANGLGTPAVAYNVPGLRDSTIDNYNCIICKNNSPENMTENIIRLLTNKELYNNLQANALAWAKKFSWEKSFQGFKRGLNGISIVI